jgi:branched-chain amino acid transport system substrate-binding protein
MMSPKKLAAVAVMALAAGGASAQATQGVSASEIVVGSIQDFSGPIAAYGRDLRNGMTMAIDESNEKGIYGRKIRAIFEDSAYDPRKAALAAQKLVNQDRIFAMIGHLGTAHNNAAMPIQFEKNVLNFFPVTAAREMYDPFHRLKYAFAATYYDQMRGALPKMVRERNVKKVCIIYQDDEFGLEVLRGGEVGLKTLNMQFEEKTSYKRGATDFSSQVARMKADACELVVLGTLIRETIGTIAESRKTGFNPIFLGTSGAYTDLIHRLGGPAMNGLFTTMTVQHPYLDDANPQLRAWANKYKARFNADPSVFSAYGYIGVENFARGLQKAGQNLTTDSFIAAMDTMSVPADVFGSAPATFGPQKRLGSNAFRLSQIQEGRWKVISEYAEPPKE